MIRPTLIVALALSLASAGCLANLTGKDEADAALGESLDQMDAAMDATADAMNATADGLRRTNGSTAPTAPPVARITAFAASGALVYKATFQAEDAKEPVFVEEGTTVKLIAADSEAIAPGATLTGFAWTLNGKSLGSMKAADAAVEGPGKYTVVLNVTDSNGRSDEQSIVLAVAPKPFDVVTELTSEPVAGAEGAGQSAALTFKLALADAEMPAMVQAIKFVAAPPASCDIGLAVKLPAGDTLGSVDNAGMGGDETVSGGMVPEGDYAIELVPITPCVAAQGVAVTVTVTFLPIIDGLDAGDGHGGHAH